jgi:predicted kinase
MNRHLVLAVGPPGAGKSTLAAGYVENGYTRISQDANGRDHLRLFDLAVSEGRDVFIDRLNFTKEQRTRYLDVAKAAGYSTKIIILYQPFSVCLERCLNRKDHETIKDEENARSALNMFFTKYEPVENTEADKIFRVWPEGERPSAIWCDLDGTLANCEHRRHFVKRQEGKKDWKGFFDAMSDDKANPPVMEFLQRFKDTHSIVYCSGRPDSYRKETEKWLKDNNAPNGELFMRNRTDSRQDYIIKEILLDFEVLPRYNLFVCLDDRDQVVKMLRKRGLNVFQVAEGDF